MPHIYNEAKNGSTQQDNKQIISILRFASASKYPYIAARHDNTGNEHYQAIIRTTDVNGKRSRDNFINKNTNRAAACIALKYGLEAPKKAAEREKDHQKAEGRRAKEDTPSTQAIGFSIAD